MNDSNKVILNTVVGSQAHGLATPESDFDFRGVFIVKTSDILSLGNVKQTTTWQEAKNDDVKFELAHFLHLASHSNPTILETFLAPIVPEETTEDGMRLRGLFPHVWSSAAVRDAFIGYSLNQQTKMLADKDKRPNKYAAAYLRTLYNAYELLTTGTFTICIADTEVGEMVRKFKMTTELDHGEVISVCRKWKAKVDAAYDANPDKKTNLEPVNEFLLDMRKKHW